MIKRVIRIQRVIIIQHVIMVNTKYFSRAVCCRKPCRPQPSLPLRLAMLAPSLKHHDIMSCACDRQPVMNEVHFGDRGTFNIVCKWKMTINVSDSTSDHTAILYDRWQESSRGTVLCCRSPKRERGVKQIANLGRMTLVMIVAEETEVKV